MSTAPAQVHFEVRARAPVAADVLVRSSRAASSSAIDGQVAFTFAAADGWDIVRVTGVGDYFLSDDLIVCHLTHPEHAALVPVHLFGMVLSLWLERRGVLTLHASAVVAAGGTLVVLAPKGGGKTTLSAALVRAGAALLTDDLLALRETPDGFAAYPAYPQLRMTAAQVGALIGNAAGLPVVNPTTGKYGVPVEHLGAFSDGPAPVQAIYVPQRHDGGEVVIEPVGQRQAFLEVVRHTFLPREVADLGLQRERFHRLANLAAQVPFRRIRVPSGHRNLPAVAARMLEDAGEG